MRTETNPFQLVYAIINNPLSREKAIHLIHGHIDELILEMANLDNQIFHSSQSRLQYLFTTEKITKELFQELNQFKQNWLQLNSAIVFNSALSIWIRLIAIVSKSQIPADLQQFSASVFHPDESPLNLNEISSFSGRVSLLKIDPELRLTELVLDNPQKEIIKLKLEDLPESKSKLILQAAKYLKLPFDLFVHNFSQNNHTTFIDEIIILPDYLVDVTSIASCYSNAGSNPLKHLIHLFYSGSTSYSTLVGTTVNQFLDELILNPDYTFDELSKNVFQFNPLAFSLLNDIEVIRFYDTIKSHFNNIQKVINSEFEGESKHFRDYQMEPSFYSVQYGIQGRLDLFYDNKAHCEKTIIELKSGKPYLSNRYGINPDHHAQIMLYYLLIQSVFGNDQKVQCQILYSSQVNNALRAAPVLPELKQELIYLRNNIIILHLHLAFRKNEDAYILDLIGEKNFSLSASYTKRDAEIIVSAYQKLDLLEKNYFKVLSNFIAREQFISKLGRSHNQYTEGLASLWLLDLQEKRNNYSILDCLKIREIQQESGEYPILVLEQTDHQENISNFRIGDTLVLYSGYSALNEQIFKCNLINQYPNEYHIRLRTRQFPETLLNNKTMWNLEHDSLDRSFINQYQGLLEFALAEVETRHRILGLKPSDTLPDIYYKSIEKAPVLIHDVLKKILQSKDYFLLWGPPGSGKTSYIIKHLTDILNSDTSENILLLAYTNRAVDEICEAIDEIQTETPVDYIRIGSRFAVSPKFSNRLLEEKIKQFTSRKQLKQLLTKCRIFTATIASIQGKKDLFYLKKFDTVIIDEASQILESQLAGLLCRFKRFILIGDHMQLPAVSAQTSEEAEVFTENLKHAGITNLNMSLFERLLKQAMNANWNHSFEMLKYQGRMHQDLMAFPSSIFYDNKLNILPQDHFNKQIALYSATFKLIESEADKILSSHRTIFINCESQDTLTNSKTNLTEAMIIQKLVSQLYRLHQKNLKNWNEHSLGIITPFRAQISQLKNLMQNDNLWEIPMTIDTAERYQGSTRDIIILSTVVSLENQLAQISSLNEEGVDRKLNVALTRARQQIIVVGNKQVLKNSPVYSKLIDHYRTWDLTKLQDD